jgi:hypothetical protein
MRGPELELPVWTRAMVAYFRWIDSVHDKHWIVRLVVGLLHYAVAATVGLCMTVLVDITRTSRSHAVLIAAPHKARRLPTLPGEVVGVIDPPDLRMRGDGVDVDRMLAESLDMGTDAAERGHL